MEMYNIPENPIYSAEIRKLKNIDPASDGYPLVDGEEILVYNETTMKLDAGSAETLNAAAYPQLTNLYSQCR